MTSSKTPKHVAIIMDGNGRYAQKHNQPRTFGHKKGVEVAEEMIVHAANTGVKALTLYAFSTENWSRPKAEVRFLMSLPELFFKRFLKVMIRENMRFIVIGDRNGLSSKLVRLIEDAENKTKDNTKMIVYLAFNYGGQLEIIEAVKKMHRDQIDIETLTPNQFEQYLMTPEFPAVDLLIRTSGEQRISNFLPWQLSYSELYFTDKSWPEFTTVDFDFALANFQNRKRRFGGVENEE
ncbi:MAG: isoprenyl transferase [Culicoidibacterales bacterium]